MIKVPYTADGYTRKLSLPDLAEITGIPKSVLYGRYNKGWRGEALFAPVQKDRSQLILTHAGKTLTLKQWAVELGISYETLRKRIKAGKSIADVLNPELYEPFVGAHAYDPNPIKESKETNSTRKPSIADTPITYKGYTFTLKQWAAELGLQYDTLKMRYLRGKTGSDLLYSELNFSKRNPDITHAGKTQSLKEWAKELDIPFSTLKVRLDRGLPTERLLAPLSKVHKLHTD
jgi:hypothetical protein